MFKEALIEAIITFSAIFSFFALCFVLALLIFIIDYLHKRR